jgi:modulator of FtsH protease HflK
MAWNQSGDDQGAKRRAGAAAAGAPWWRRLKQGWAGRRGARGSLYGTAAGTALVLWLLSGCYQLDEGQHGVVERFGAYAGERGAGLGWHLPWPIETLTRVDLGRLNSVDFQSRMLSADTGLLNITGSVQYQLRDARQVLYGLREPDRTVRDLGEAATRQLMATHSVEETLSGKTRTRLIEALRGTVQQRLDTLGAGVRVLSVNLTDVQVPEPVLAAQREAEQARQDRERLAREAQGYAGDLLPRAQEVAQRQRLEAEAYKSTVIATAEGDAARFEPLLAAYERAPEVTRNRLYVETIETILARSRKVIIDGKGSGNSFTIPLERLLDTATARGTGVSGVIEAPAPAPAPASGGGVKAPRVSEVPATEHDARSRDRAER